MYNETRGLFNSTVSMIGNIVHEASISNIGRVRFFMAREI